MATGKLTWDDAGEKLYTIGCDRGVLYPQVAGAYPTGVAWNGLTKVTKSPSGADAQDFYADNILYGSLRGAERLGGTIEAYYSPEEFDACDGAKSVANGVTIHQQKRQPFGFCYRSLIGNDEDGMDHGYKLNLIYNATVSPSEQEADTINDSPEPGTLSWEFNTIPVNVTSIEGAKPTSLIEIDSTKISAAALKAIEDALYGTDTTEPHLPSPDEVIALIVAADTAA